MAVLKILMDFDQVCTSIRLIDVTHHTLVGGHINVFFLKTPLVSSTNLYHS